MTVDYVVKVSGGLEVKTGKQKGKKKSRDESRWAVFLPCFQLPVGRLEVNVEMPTGTFHQKISFRR